ncbi:hypothetical protein MNB_SV-14-109 [hydrothermal vent metagenome]|uniref:Lcl C-terminal domain-containing protein n=1 Tax=hydrothermal vent metagenome TaxID=652676 RepID=A0A1W1BXI0_9ZZZZ
MKWKHKAILALALITQLSASTEDNNSERFTTISFNHQTILQDNYTKLEWINGREDEANQTIDDGCISFNVTSENNNIVIKEKAESYCKKLNFASYNDWRVPTDKEYQSLIKAVKESNLSIHYNSPSCINALGLDKDRLNIIDTNMSSNSVGEITPFKKNNITTCLRCVRDGEEPLAP